MYEKNFKKIYKKVLKKFPEIRKNEIELNYRRAEPFFLTTISMYDHSKLDSENIDAIDSRGGIKKEPLLNYGDGLFLVLLDDEIEAVIAHELGHYLCFKGYDSDKFKQVIKRKTELFQNTELDTHRIRRLKQWSIAREAYADRKSAEAGYGEILLKLLKKLYDPTITGHAKEEHDARIENLEKILGEKDA